MGENPTLSRVKYISKDYINKEKVFKEIFVLCINSSPKQKQIGFQTLNHKFPIQPAPPPQPQTEAVSKSSRQNKSKN